MSALGPLFVAPALFLIVVLIAYPLSFVLSNKFVERPSCAYRSSGAAACGAGG